MLQVLIPAQAQAGASGSSPLMAQAPDCVAGFVAHAFLRRRKTHMPVTRAVAKAPTPKGSQAGPTLGVCQLVKPAPASDKPPRRGIASGMAQHAAHAPATPKTANKGFFIVSFIEKERGNSRMLTLESQAA